MDRELEILRSQFATLPNPELAYRNDSLGYLSRRLSSPDEPFWVEVDLQREQPIDSIALLPVWVDFPRYAGDGYGFPLRFKIEVLDESRSSPRVVANESEADYPNPDWYPYLVRCAESVTGRFVRITSLKHWKSEINWFFALSEIMVIQGVRNIAVNCPVHAGEGEDFPTNSWGFTKLTDFQYPLGPPTKPEESPSNGFLCEHSSREDSIKWVQVDLEEEMKIEEIRLLPSRPLGIADPESLGFPIQFRLEMASVPGFDNPIPIYETGGKDYPNPGDNPVVFPVGGRTGRYVRFTGLKLHYFWENFYSFSLAEMQIYSGGRNVALGKPVSASDVSPTAISPRWQPEGLVDGYDSRQKLIELPDWLEGLEQRKRLENRIEGLARQRAEKADRVILLSVVGTVGGSGLLVASLATLFLYNRSERRRRMERLRRQIARDLHDDIGSNLGAIALLSESGINQADITEETRNDLLEIHSIATSSSEAMSDIVWLISENRSSLAELLVRLRHTANCIFPHLSHTFQVRPRQSPRLMLSLKVRRHLYFAFKETLHNICKHARATRVSISINVDVSRRTLTFEVQDNGRGFNPGDPALGHGLRNLQLRSKKLDGYCNITSAPGKGTIIVFSASLKS